jgi:hypothetical protein
MTKKNDLIQAIRQAGHKANRNMTFDELNDIYSKLHVHALPDETERVELPDQDEEIEQEGNEPQVVTETAPAPETETEPEKEETPTPEVAPGEATPGEVKNDFDDLMGKIGGATPPEPKATKDKPLIEKTRKRAKKGESSPESFRIEGYVLLLITDTVFPFTFSFINNLMDKKIKVDAQDLQLTQKDFDKLEPLADQAANYMSINLNPIAGFLLVSTFMYSNNLIMIRTHKEAQ